LAAVRRWVVESGWVRVGHAGGEEPVVDAGEELGGVQAGVGDLVAVAVRDAFDQSVHAQASQVVRRPPC
jgi:hypothetical protein